MLSDRAQGLNPLVLYADKEQAKAFVTAMLQLPSIPSVVWFPVEACVTKPPAHLHVAIEGKPFIPIAHMELLVFQRMYG